MSFDRLIVPHENYRCQVVDDLLTSGRLDHKFVKVLDRQRATDIARAFPAVNVIFRDPRGGRNLSDWRRDYPDPLVCAEVILRAGAIDALPNVWVESNINEPKLLSLDDARWLGIVDATRSRALHAARLRAAIGSFGTSHPPIDLFVEYMRTFVEHGGSVGDLIAVHEYGHKAWTPADRSNLLHCVDLRAALRGMACERMLFAITESGFDDVGPGTGGYLDPEAHSSEADLVRVMSVYEGELARAGFAVAICVFAYNGGGTWRYFEMTSADSFNASIAALPKPPAYTGDNPPEDWTHVVDATLGLNVRSSPTTTDSSGAYTKANVVGVLVHGCKVRAVSTEGQWTLINWPTIGYVYAPNLDEREIVKPVERRLAELVSFVHRQRLIDISANQVVGDVPFETLSDAGYVAVMIRITVGLQEDVAWLAHWRAAGSLMRRFFYSVFSFTVSWERQVDVLLKALDRVPLTPTVALDLELPNTSKKSDALNAAIDKLHAAGVPLAWYGRALWLADNLSDASKLKQLPFIVAHYKSPADDNPLVPDGFEARAWQYVAGEHVIPSRMYWGLAMTRSLKHLDESKVLPLGLSIHAA
jgi:hypothetical protein